MELLRGDIGVLEEKISKYFSTFKQEDFFTFANRKERKNFYKKEYLNFILNSKETLDAMENNISCIAALLLDADRNGNSEGIEYYNRIFCAYLNFRMVINEYTMLMKKELSKETPSLSSLFSALEKLRMGVFAFGNSL